MEVQLPGFRFHPTEEELLNFYLKSVVNAKSLRSDIIGFLNIYQHDPWDLPGIYSTTLNFPKSMGLVFVLSIIKVFVTRAPAVVS